MAITREEFVNNINSVWELQDFCNENGYEDLVSDIVDADTRDNYIDEGLSDLAHDNYWQDLRSILNHEYEDNGYDNYIWDDYNYRYRPLTDDDVESIKEDLLDRLDDDGFWEDEEEGEEATMEYHYDPSEYEDEPETDSVWRKESVPESDDSEDFDLTNDEGITVVDIINAGIGCLRQMKTAEASEDDFVVDFPL